MPAVRGFVREPVGQMSQCGHVQLPVGHAAHDVRIQPAQEVDVEVHVRSGRHEREPLREAVQEFEDRVRDGLPVDRDGSESNNAGRSPESQCIEKLTA